MISHHHKQIKSLKERVEHLNKLLVQKKTLIENEMLQTENLCKEIIKLQEQLETLEGKFNVNE